MLRVVGSGKVVAANAFRGNGGGAPRVVTNAVRNFSGESKHSRLVEALDSEIKVMQLMNSRPPVPDDFPFKIHHYFNTHKICMLERDLDGEEIRIRAYDVGDSQNQNNSDDDTTSTDSDSDSNSDEQSESDSESKPKQCVVVPLEVEISKVDDGTEKSMKFVATAFADDEILIEKLTTKEYHDGTPIHSHIEITPESELQVAFREFLKMRGIEKSVGEFLYGYRLWRSKHDESTGKALGWYSEEDVDQKGALESLTKLKQVIQEW